MLNRGLSETSFNSSTHGVSLAFSSVVELNPTYRATIQSKPLLKAISRLAIFFAVFVILQCGMLVQNV